MNTLLITPKALAQTLGVSVRTLNRWHALRKGPRRFSIGKLAGYRPQAIEAWLAANEVPSGNAANDNTKGQ